MFSYFFRQIFNSFGVFFRTIRAFFARRLVGLGARFRAMTNFSRHATKVASASFQGAAAAMKNPTRREDYLETNRLFISKAFLIKLLLGLVVLGLVAYFLVWPFLLSKFFTAHFWQENEKVDTWSGKVVVYYDKEKDLPKYRGRLEEGVLQGKGTEYDENGLVSYEGGFVDGLHSGSGTCYEEGVLLYQGELAAGVYEGQGTLYRDGMIAYEGGFVQGVPDGIGKSYDETGALVYDGAFRAGVYHGEGVLYHPNGEVRYIGGFDGGVYDGKGRLTDEDGMLVYEGGFFDGLYETKGTLYEEGKLVYEGGFSEGLKEGQGEEYLPEGILIYEGGFSADRYQGEGVLYRDDGMMRYKGGFAKGLYEGSGTLYLDDDRGYIEAIFVSGSPDGTIRWFIDNKLWYEGGADGLVPDGFGELYTRSGKKIYAGEMDRGTIDGQWILTLSAEEVREAFAEATVVETGANDKSFFVMNRELGVVVRCSYRGEDSDTAVFSIWISRENSDQAWQDVAAFGQWTDTLKTDTSMAELMFWADDDSFEIWVQEMPEGEPARHESFPEHDMRKERYFFDGWYCTVAIDLETGLPNMVSWTADAEIPELELDALMSEDVQAVQEEAEALLTELDEMETQMLQMQFTPTPPEEGSDASGEEAPETDEKQPEADAQKPEGGEEQLPEEEAVKVLTADEQKKLIDSLLDYYENTWILKSLESAQPRLEEELTAATERLNMGTGSQNEVDDLQLQADAYQLRITQCQANLDKTLLTIQTLAELDPTTMDLKPLLLCFNPVVLEEEMVCGEVAESDVVAAKASLINLKVNYETVQYNCKSMENAIAAVKTTISDFSRGAADQMDLTEALMKQNDCVVQFYTALIGFVRELNTLNHLTGGWIAEQTGWSGDILEMIG